MRGLKEEQRSRFEQLEHLVEETRGMVEIQVPLYLKLLFNNLVRVVESYTQKYKNCGQTTKYIADASVVRASAGVKGKPGGHPSHHRQLKF